jgi:hypothetical protein
VGRHPGGRVAPAAGRGGVERRRELDRRRKKARRQRKQHVARHEALHAPIRVDKASRHPRAAERDIGHPRPEPDAGRRQPGREGRDEGPGAAGDPHRRRLLAHPLQTPRRLTADPLEEHVAITVLLEGRQPEPAHQRPHGRLDVGPEPRRAEIETLAGERLARLRRQDPPAEPRAGLEQHEINVGLVETVGSDEAGKAAADDEDGRVHSRDPDSGRKAGDVRTTGRSAASCSGRVMAILVPGPASNRPAWSERKNTGDRAAKRPSSSGWPFCLQIKELLELDVERAMGVENVEWLRSGCAALSASS